MAYVKYRDIEDYYIPNKIPFQHGSMNAVRTRDAYVVRSYSTVIAEIYPNNKVFLNKNKYSPTTSRQQNLIRRVCSKKDWRYSNATGN